MSRASSRYLLTVFFVTAGVFHFAFSKNYEAIVPLWIPQRHAAVVISGWGEIAGGLAVLVARLRLVARYGLIALCLAVLPANVQMLQNAMSSDASSAFLALLWLRLPAQGLLIWWIWYSTSEEKL